jgi:glycerophosphoryl diester phosphodiesterase
LTLRDIKEAERTIIGHRGSGAGIHPSGVRENTIPSFDLTFHEGAGEVEMDLALTSDNVIVIVHNDAVVYNRNKIKIQNITFNELRKIQPEIPTLDEVMSRFPHRQFIAELKSHTRWDHIIDILHEKGLLAGDGRMKFISFNPDALLKIKKTATETYCSLIVTATEPKFSPFVTNKHIAWCKINHIEEIAGHVWLFTERMIERTHEASLKAGLGQIDSDRSLRKAMRCHVKRLYTNRVEWLIKRLNPHCSKNIPQ